MSRLKLVNFSSVPYPLRLACINTHSFRAPLLPNEGTTGSTILTSSPYLVRQTSYFLRVLLVLTASSNKASRLYFVKQLSNFKISPELNAVNNRHFTIFHVNRSRNKDLFVCKTHLGIRFQSCLIAPCWFQPSLW